MTIGMTTAGITDQTSNLVVGGRLHSIFWSATSIGSPVSAQVDPPAQPDSHPFFRLGAAAVAVPADAPAVPMAQALWRKGG
jgi:hypothetical protein